MKKQLIHHMGLELGAIDCIPENGLIEAVLLETFKQMAGQG